MDDAAAAAAVAFAVLAAAVPSAVGGLGIVSAVRAIAVVFVGPPIAASADVVLSVECVDVVALVSSPRTGWVARGGVERAMTLTTAVPLSLTAAPGLGECFHFA